MPNPNEVMDVEGVNQALNDAKVPEHNRVVLVAEDLRNTVNEAIWDYTSAEDTEYGIPVVRGQENATDVVMRLVDAHVAQQNAALLRELSQHKDELYSRPASNAIVIEAIPASILEAKLNKLEEQV